MNWWSIEQSLEQHHGDDAEWARYLDLLLLAVLVGLIFWGLR